MRNTTRKYRIPISILLYTLCSFISPAHAQAQYTGVNLAGADFGTGNLPGTYNTDYTYPTHAEVDYFTGKGMNIFRLPFMWERLQNDQYSAFNADELARISDFVSYATSKQARVILDPHNGARYYGEIINIDGANGALPLAAFEDFWTKLSSAFKDNDKVIFGLMNEPHDMPSELWRDDANAAISAIRATGADNLILVPGNAWTGAHSWNDDSYGTPNSVVMQDIVDPGNNMAFEVHQYLDTDSSGTSENCVSSTIGSERLQDFTNWLRQNNAIGFLGEFAGGRNENCLSGLDNMLDHIDSNDDVWLGWTYWAAGPWWGEDIFTLEPVNGTDRPQMAVLLEHMSSGSSTAGLLPTDDSNTSVNLEDGTLAVSKWEHAFFRFDVSARVNEVSTATLRVYHQGQLTPLTLTVNEAEHDEWSEDSEPPPLVSIQDNPELAIDSAVVTGAGYSEFDITDFVATEVDGDGIVSVELSSDHDNWSFVSSREGAHSPELVILPSDTNILPPAAANLVAPSGNISDHSPEYSWNAVAGSTWYYLWVNDSSGNAVRQWFTAEDAQCSDGTGTCAVTPLASLESGAAQWWVQTWNSAGRGPWSQAKPFVLNGPVAPPAAATLISPEGEIGTSTPSYSWDAVADASWYYLWVNDSTGNKVKQWYSASAAGCASGTGSCSVNPSIPLAPGTGRWWIHTWNTAGAGQWSHSREFSLIGNQ